MRKTLGDMAKHLKNVITPEMPETYAINLMFTKKHKSSSI